MQACRWARVVGRQRRGATQCWVAALRRVGVPHSKLGATHLPMTEVGQMRHSTVKAENCMGSDQWARQSKKAKWRREDGGRSEEGSRGLLPAFTAQLAVRGGRAAASSSAAAITTLPQCQGKLCACTGGEVSSTNTHALLLRTPRETDRLTLTH